MNTTLIGEGTIRSQWYVRRARVEEKHVCLTGRQVAAAAGRVELCDFLLEGFSSLCSDTELYAALGAYLQEYRFGERQIDVGIVTEAFYKLFIGKYGLQIDLQDMVQSRERLNGIDENSPEIERNTLLTKAALHEVLTTQHVPFGVWSFAQRFHVVVNSCCWPAESFIELLRPVTLTELALYKDKYGRTALHWAAEHFGYWEGRSYSDKGRRIRDSYAKLSVQLISMGADLHATDSTHETPLSCMLQDRYHSHSRIWPFELARLVRRWGCAIGSVCNLRSYADRESSLQAQRGYRFHGLRLEGFSEIQSYRLSVSEATILIIDVTGSLSSVLWKFCPPPGAWERTAHRIDLVSWRPTAYFEGESHYMWQEADCVSRSLEASFSEEVEGPSLKTSFSDARYELISGVQDDHGFVAAQWRGRTIRPTKHHMRRQAASLPPPQFLVDDAFNPFEDLELGSFSEWIRRAHKCSLDMSWKRSWDGLRGQLDTRRRCMQGRCGDWEPVLLGTDFWEAKLLEDTDNIEIARRFTDRFHPEWRSVLEENHRKAQRRLELGLN
jgi:hypothetical protein